MDAMWTEATGRRADHHAGACIQRPRCEGNTHKMAHSSIAVLRERERERERASRSNCSKATKVCPVLNVDSSAPYLDGGLREGPVEAEADG